MKIRQLPPEIAEKIAAGEVIERPSSVVKELVENSIDAGATQIQVVLEDGGKGLIEITDNGVGMESDELSLSVARHATSKLKALSDLETLRTLGFRGEALASIRAASGELKIVSRQVSSTSAFEWNQGKVSPVAFGTFLGKEHGTRIQVHSLFAEIPVRLKFLKTAQAEVSQIRDALERISISYPEIGFNLISNDRTVFSVKPESHLARITSILESKLPTRDYKCVAQIEESPSFNSSVYYLAGASLSHSRGIFISLNQRPIKDRMILSAVQNAFKQSLLPGQSPCLYLDLKCDPSLFDVNAHPTKLEVKFLNSQAVFQSVFSAIQKTLFAQLESPKAESLDISAPFQPPAHVQSIEQLIQSSIVGAGAPEIQTSLGLAPQRQYPYLGQVFGTYLLFLGSNNQELWCVDQHAAHERIQYEKLLKEWKTGTFQSQALLIPEVLTLTRSGTWSEYSMSQMEAALHQLEPYGFESEIFGQDKILVRGVPGFWVSNSHDQIAERFSNLVHHMLTKGGDPLDEVLFEKLAMSACKSSIRANERFVEGNDMGLSRAQELLSSLLDCEHPWNCPHGRPTLISWTQTQFENLFCR